MVQGHAALAQWCSFCECCVDNSSNVRGLCLVEIHLEEHLLKAHRRIFTPRVRWHSVRPENRNCYFLRESRRTLGARVASHGWYYSRLEHCRLLLLPQQGKELCPAGKADLGDRQQDERCRVVWWAQSPANTQNSLRR